MTGFYPIGEGPGTRGEPPFGPDFFKRRFFEYMQQVCRIGGKCKALELLLTSGDSIDVCQIEEIDDAYMRVEVFRDSHSSTDMYQTYIRYETIFRINVMDQELSERPVGFNANHAPRIRTADTQLAGIEEPAKAAVLKAPSALLEAAGESERDTANRAPAKKI